MIMDTTSKSEFNGTKTPQELKDQWRTPPQVIQYFNNIGFNFTLDVAASENNAITPEYFTEEQDALSNEWRTDGIIWCNPPYSKIGPWVDKATKEAKKGAAIVMLVPNSTDTKWFKKATETADVMLVTGGRIPFINAITGKPVKGNTRGSLFLLWPANNTTTTPDYCHVAVSELMSGQTIEQRAA